MCKKCSAAVLGGCPAGVFARRAAGEDALGTAGKMSALLRKCD